MLKVKNPQGQDKGSGWDSPPVKVPVRDGKLWMSLVLLLAIIIQRNNI